MRPVPDPGWRLSPLWDANIPNVVMAQRHSFELAVNNYRDRSEWMGFLDLDELVSFGPEATAVPGQSFPQWLAALPAAVDWVFLHWVFYPMATQQGMRGGDGGYPIVFDASHFFRFDDVSQGRVAGQRVCSPLIQPPDVYSQTQIWRTQDGYSGKSFIRPRLFHGKNTIHHFDPINWQG